MIRYERKALSFIISVIFLIGIFVPNNSVNASIFDYGNFETYYVSIDKVAARIEISGIKAKCYSELKASSSNNLTIKMELQKKKSTGYSTVQTWTSSKTGTFISYSQSKNINLLYDYRLKTTFSAGSETKIIYSYPS